MVDFSKPVRFKYSSFGENKTITRIVTDLVGRPHEVTVFYTHTNPGSIEQFGSFLKSDLENIPEKKYVASVLYRPKSLKDLTWDVHAISLNVFTSEQEVRNSVQRYEEKYKDSYEYRIISITEFEE